MTNDFLIVGGGFVGLSTAYWLRELAPGAKILLLERSHLGAGASGKNAGFLTKGSALFYQNLIHHWGEEGAREILNFSKVSLSLLQERILSPLRIEHEKTSSLTLYREEKPSLPRDFGFLPEASPFPGLFAGALRSDGEFKVHPRKLLEGMYQDLRNRGIQFEFGSTSKMEERAEKTIYCLNAYTSSVLPDFQNRIRPQRAQMLKVHLHSSSQIGEELFYDPEERVYFRRDGRDELWIGGKRILDAKREETLEEGNSDIIQKALEDYLLSLGLNFEVKDRWSGIMGFTERELPLLEEQGSRLILGGFSGHGMGLGFHAGKVAAERVLEKKALKTGPGLFTF